SFEASDEVVRVYSRSAAASTSDPFRPFLLLADPDLLKGFTGEARIVALEGEGAYRWLAEFSSWGQCLKARDHCQRLSVRAAGSAASPYRFLSDPVHRISSVRDERPFSAWPSRISGAWPSTSRSRRRPASSSRTPRASPTASSPSRSPTPAA